MSLLPIDSHSSSKSQSILLFLETLLELLIPRDVIREVRVDFLYELAALWRRSRVMYLSVIETSVFGFGSPFTDFVSLESVVPRVGFAGCIGRHCVLNKLIDLAE